MTDRSFFVTGTDTGVGKTLISCALLQACVSRGFSTAAMKPVASGCRQTAAGLRHDDALLLQAHMTADLEYALVNPCALTTPVSPHLAARQDDVDIDFDHIEAVYRQVARLADVIIIEGVGGWRTPLHNHATVADLACRLSLPVILVVGIRLGCLNHALLTYEAIIGDGLPVAGWVANINTPDGLCIEENIATLENSLRAPLIGTVPCAQNADARLLAGHLNLKQLL